MMVSERPLDRTQGLAVHAGEQIGTVVELKDVERHERIYRLLKAGEALGAAAHAVQMTRNYVLERKQFGVQIATFQALQHKLADMYRYVEQMQSLYRFAGWAASYSADQEPLVSLAAIKFIYNHAVEVIEGAVQLHGGIGFTWEYDLHLLLRRAKMNEALIRLSKADNKLLLKSSC
jgi:alkylation response protein AidB-like acyl-CoA dehydrogenase